MNDKERSAFLEARRGSLGASDVATVLGLSEFGSPFEVWASKVHGTDMGQMSEAAFAGLANEDAIFAMWQHFLAKRDLRTVRMDVEQPGILRAPELPWAHATPDRIVTPAGGDVPYVVQLKSTDTYRGWGREGGAQHDETPLAVPSIEPNGNVPTGYYLQVIWEMHIAGLVTGQRAAFGLLVVRIGASQMRSYRVGYNPALAAQLVDRCGAWWERHVVGGEPPAVGARDGSTLARIHPDVHGTVNLDPALSVLIRDLERAQRDRKHHQDQADAYKAKLIEALGPARAGIVETELGERLMVTQRRKMGRNGPYTIVNIKDAGRHTASAPHDGVGLWGPDALEAM